MKIEKKIKEQKKKQVKMICDDVKPDVKQNVNPDVNQQVTENSKQDVKPNVKQDVQILKTKGWNVLTRDVKSGQVGGLREMVTILENPQVLNFFKTHLCDRASAIATLKIMRLYVHLRETNDVLTSVGKLNTLMMNRTFRRAYLNNENDYDGMANPEIKI